MAGKIEGILTPTLVPLDESGQINEAEYRRFLNWLIERGVHGLYPNGSTGEFTRLTAEERRRIELSGQVVTTATAEAEITRAGEKAPAGAHAADARAGRAAAARAGA
jgi:dihydrodipicolinate synthase/N-acetylneuraminate lyase